MARKQAKISPPADANFPLSSMIDVVFLLLIFFLVTQKPNTEEVMINVELPAPDMSTVAADPLSIPIVIRGDRQVQYYYGAKVLDAIKKTGLYKVSLAGVQE